MEKTRVFNNASPPKEHIMGTTEMSGTNGIGDALQPIWSYPIGQGAWDPVSAALIRLDVLYEYAVAAGDMPEVQRIGEEMARLVEHL